LIRRNRSTDMPASKRAVPREQNMADIRKNQKPAKKDEDAAKAKRPPPPQPPDDDYEDGDIATPKRDRYGPDDEPL
jgi:hypothetical protein